MRHYNDGPPLPGLPRGVVDPAAAAVRRKGYLRPLSDLKMCLQHAAVAHHWVDARADITRTLLGLLRTMQGMNPYVRKTGGDNTGGLNHNTIVYQYRSCTRCHLIVPAHYRHSVIQCRPNSFFQSCTPRGACVEEAAP